MTRIFLLQIVSFVNRKQKEYKRFDIIVMNDESIIFKDV